LGISILCMISNAQTPYYFYNYKGEGVYLSLNTKYAFLSLKEQRFPVDIQQRNIRSGDLKPDGSDKKQYQTGKGTNRYYAVLGSNEKMTEEQYLMYLSETKALKGQNHQHRATPCDWSTETFQALKGRQQTLYWLTPFQGFNSHVLLLHRALPDANAKRLSALTIITSCLFFHSLKENTIIT